MKRKKTTKPTQKPKIIPNKPEIPAISIEIQEDYSGIEPESTPIEEEEAKLEAKQQGEEGRESWVKPTREQRVMQKKQAYIQHMRETFGDKPAALRHVGITRSAVDLWYKHDPEFRREVEDCRKELAEIAERELYTRAVHGTLKKIYSKTGELVDTVMQKSDLLLIFLLKGLMPQVYNPAVKVAQTDADGRDKYSSVTPEQLKALCLEVAKKTPQQLYTAFDSIDTCGAAVDKMLGDDGLGDKFDGGAGGGDDDGGGY